MTEWLGDWNQAEAVALLRSCAYTLLALGNAIVALGSRREATQDRLRSLAAMLVPVYCLLAVNTLLHGDEFVLPWIRDLFKQHHWYGLRRALQAGLLLALAIWAYKRLRRNVRIQRDHGEATSWMYRLLYWGGVISSGLAVLRLVSFHYTDAVLNSRMAGLRIGGWVEAAAVLAAATAIVLNIHRRNVHV